ncbi:Gmad2 immunoglobulin-like domain-containing protein [Nocardioides bizhenqiangii]|uniref:Gmad2 immunoglobulin-like domain-containing protein n=1 Tax=Nocardioides bizhenqiangii TaxID=3095076 RepID=A0ABZ0ZW87_9ACTN|nr:MULTISPECIES: Gmad2 immunoglobulin-like domain-containing protein [unclassified Nocardioides]MDZ5623232.1 Gmad2 immunoglobulin-like domain-containing protein [Nocardioides sp. HM23]WQQ28204.1 Gmad2 immunoglobulin-like domain-containing protein [Nocardioides sp. HM61]
MKRHAFPLAVAATITALVLSGCGDDDEPDSNADDPASTPASETSEPTPTDVTTATSEPTATEASTPPAETVSVPVFFVGDTPQGPRLFAEQRDVEADNPLEEAVALMTAGDTLDADYRTLFPGGGFASVEFDGDRFVVTTQDDGWNTPVGMSKLEAKLAVQQLVYTLQGVEGEQAPVVVEPSGLLFGIDAEDGIEAADELSTRGLVNVTSPAEGATVSGSFEASGEASSFEATVPWLVRDESDTTVVEGFSTAEGYIDGLYPWEATVDVSGLEPGEYTFVAMTDDPSGGEGPGPTEDTKTIVVE